MSNLVSEIQPIKIAISAMGGQGGGVLSNWIRDVAEAHDYLAQSTSVPGVAQRTGATIYYLEIFPEAEAKRVNQLPVLSMNPVPGDVDLLIAAELVEAGRAVQRGFVTPDRTTLIAATHRSYTVAEKEQMGNGLADSGKIMSALQAASKDCIAFDMEQLAKDNQSVISSVLFGAIAGTRVLPFKKEEFEEAIRKGGIAVETNLKAFEAAYQRAEQHMLETPEDSRQEKDLPVPQSAATPQGEALLQRIKGSFPAEVQGIVCEGVRQLVDYQDFAYAELYLDRMDQILARDKESNFALSRETARYLALWMAFQDTIRVADQKTRRERSERIRSEVKAQPGQFVYPVEFLHPRYEEICDTLPKGLGEFMLNSGGLKKLLGGLFTHGRKLQTGKLSGYLLMYTLASLRFMRRSTLRYAHENTAIEAWLQNVLDLAGRNYALALAVSRAPRLIKGYGPTHARGMKRFNAVMKVVEQQGSSLSGVTVQELCDAALAGEDGKAFDEALAALPVATTPSDNVVEMRQSAVSA
jgi:indolepyruvate ferredoxin oxidoreductase beta subunit